MGTEAVLESIGGSTGFAFGAARASGVLGIGTIGGELGLGERRAVGRGCGSFHGYIFVGAVRRLLRDLGKVLRRKEIEARIRRGRVAPSCPSAS